MFINWQDLRVLREPQKPRVEPCGKDGGCVAATGPGVALAAFYQAGLKPYLIHVDHSLGDHKFHDLCCHACYPSMAVKHGVFASYGKVFEGACTYCGVVVKGTLNSPCGRKGKDNEY